MPYAKCELGVKYYYGTGIKKDTKKAFEIFTELAQKGYYDAFARLGDFYLFGVDVPQNIDKAVQYYEKALSIGISHVAKERLEIDVPAMRKEIENTVATEKSGRRYFFTDDY